MLFRSLPRRSLRDCLAEELRRLDPDSLYGDVIRHALERSTAGHGYITASTTVRKDSGDR